MSVYSYRSVITSYIRCLKSQSVTVTSFFMYSCMTGNVRKLTGKSLKLHIFYSVLFKVHANVLAWRTDGTCALTVLYWPPHFYGLSQTNISSAARHFLWTQPVSIVSIPHANQREQLASASVCWLHRANSMMKNRRKKTSESSEEDKMDGSHNPAVQPFLIWRPHPLHLHLHLFTVHPISPLSICTLSSPPVCFSSLFFPTASSLHTSPSQQPPLLRPQYGGCCSVPVTPSGFTLSLPLTPFIL